MIESRRWERQSMRSLETRQLSRKGAAGNGTNHQLNITPDSPSSEGTNSRGYSMQYSPRNPVQAMHMCHATFLESPWRSTLNSLPMSRQKERLKVGREAVGLGKRRGRLPCRHVSGGVEVQVKVDPRLPAEPGPSGRSLLFRLPGLKLLASRGKRRAVRPALLDRTMVPLSPSPGATALGNSGCSRVAMMPGWQSTGCPLRRACAIASAISCQLNPRQ